MRSIGTRFSIVVGVFAVAFSGFILVRTWYSTRSHVEQLTALQAALRWNSISPSANMRPRPSGLKWRGGLEKTSLLWR